MGKSSIHIQKASNGAITHNSRENYSKSVVFKDEKNELWNDKKSAFQIYREELKNRVEAYTNRTNQKLQKTAVTHLSAVVNLEQHHTLKDLENIKEELEKVFDTKVFQMAIHRDEGKIKHKETGEYLVSGIDFFYNEQDNKYYTKKDKNKYENELNIYEYDIEKNYHAHIEFMGLDSQGQAIRQKMNRFVLSNLQDFTAQTLNMERGNNYQIKKSAKRLDTHDYKAEKKAENEVKKVVKNEKNKIVKKANEIINSEREDKKKLKEELEELKKENSKFREELKANQSEREHYKLQEQLNKQLQQDLKASKIDLSTALEEIEKLKKDIFHPTLKKSDDTPAKNIEVANHYIKQINSLEAQKEVLPSKDINLSEKNDSRPIMKQIEAYNQIEEVLNKQIEKKEVKTGLMKSEEVEIIPDKPKLLTKIKSIVKDSYDYLAKHYTALQEKYNVLATKYNNLLKENKDIKIENLELKHKVKELESKTLSHTGKDKAPGTEKKSNAMDLIKEMQSKAISKDDITKMSQELREEAKQYEQKNKVQNRDYDLSR